MMSIKKVKAKKNGVEKEWYIIDASGVRLGRIATTVSKILQGKHKVTYLPNVDTGDYVIVINAKMVDIFSKRLKRKKIYRHSGYPKGLKQETLESLLARKPCKVIEKAISGMLPKTKLGKEMFTKLFVYEDDMHKHKAQKPTLVEIT